MQNPSKHSGKKSAEEFEALAFPLMDKIYSTALRLTKDPLDAEDLVQNTYLRAWQYYHRYQSGTNFQSWIFKILTNNFINDYRKKKRRPFRQDFEFVTQVVPDGSEPEKENLSDQDVLSQYKEVFDDELTRALEKLPESFRTVLLLADVGDLKYKEIAKSVGCPLGTVMSRLSRARKILARQLKSYAAERGYTVRPTAELAY